MYVPYDSRAITEREAATTSVSFDELGSVFFCFSSGVVAEAVEEEMLIVRSRLRSAKAIGTSFKQLAASDASWLLPF